MDGFDLALSMILEHEKRGAAPNDPGGRTDYGISERAFPEAWADGKITYDELWHIYTTRFWYPLKCKHFDDLRLALEVFDFGVNSGPATSAKLLQRTYNALYRGESTPLVEDGVIGPKTLGVVNVLSGNLATALYQYYVALRVGWYESTKEVRANGWRQRRGWLARCGCGERWAAKAANKEL